MNDLALTGARYVLLDVSFLDITFCFIRWCGNTVTSDWLNITAQTNTMVLIFRADNFIDVGSGSPKAGFRATIFFGMLELKTSIFVFRSTTVATVKNRIYSHLISITIFKNNILTKENDQKIFCSIALQVNQEKRPLFLHM